MKRGRIQKEEGRLLLYILFFASYLSPFAIAEETLVEQAVSVFQHGDVERRYVLHLPEDLPAQSPLVFFLHGYYGDARDYAELGMNQVADTHKFAVVYPQGKKDTRGVPHWNARLSISKVDDIDASKGRLILNDVTEITPEAALKLAEFEGGDLQLNGLTTISPEIAQALAKHKGWLFLNGLSTVSKEEASALAKHESGWLYLQGLETVDDAAILALRSNMLVRLPKKFQ